MNAIHSLYKIKPSVTVDEKYGEVYAYLPFHNHMYFGLATIHPDDRELFSPRVGTKIATSRARIEALKDYKKTWETELKLRKRFYNDMLGYGSKESAAVDPSGAIKRYVERAAAKVKIATSALQKEKANLQSYFKGL